MMALMAYEGAKVQQESFAVYLESILSFSFSFLASLQY